MMSIFNYFFRRRKPKIVEYIEIINREFHKKKIIPERIFQDKYDKNIFYIIPIRPKSKQVINRQKVRFGSSVAAYEFKLNEKLIKKCRLAGISLITEYISIYDETEFNFREYK